MLGRWVGFSIFSYSETRRRWKKHLAKMQYRGRWLVVHPPGVNTGIYSWSPDLKNHIYEIKDLKNIWRQDLSIIPKMASEVHLLVMLPTEKMSPKLYKLIWAHNHQNHSNTRLMDPQSHESSWPLRWKFIAKNKHDSWRISLPRLRQASF